MPYTQPFQREYYFKQGDLEALANCLGVMKIEFAKGDLNFIVNYLVKKWLDKNDRSYFKISTMIGALEDAADELRRRELHPWEDKKIAEHGDVTAGNGGIDGTV